ncbi:AAA family ATPase [Geminicoccus roseus]|uniref:AAA family ATPase n=1 Tax=Geminicoccus roseus TaxID=404900 RepID=UPI00146FACEE|nr:P-loop NTPase [Geminicoccus roseus]
MTSHVAPPGSAAAPVPARASSTAPGDAERAALLAFLADDESEAAVQAGLADMMAGAQIRRGNVRTATRSLVSEPTPRILLVDISGIDDPIHALNELAAVCTPDVRVLVVGERSEVSFYRELTRELGVAEYIFKPLTRGNVASLFGPLVIPSGAKPVQRGGQVIAVCGARGGVGATTIAVNLALQLEATKGHIALLDLHLRGGTAAMMLGARVSNGLRVALEEPDRADALFLDRMAVTIQGRLRLIAAEEPFEAQIDPSPEAVSQLLELLRQRFSQIVVDLPMPPSSWERQVLAEARHSIVVFGPDLAGIRDAEATRRMMTSMSSSSQPILVLNRASMPGGLKLPLIIEGLGRRPDVVIPDLPRHLPRAANLGQSAGAGSAPLRKALAPITQEIFGVRAEAGGRSSLLRWLLAR